MRLSKTDLSLIAYVFLLLLELDTVTITTNTTINGFAAGAFVMKATRSKYIYISMRCWHGYISCIR